MAGDGSIYRRDERTWVAQLSIGGRANRRFVRRNARTRPEARAALDDLKAEHRTGVRPTRLTVSDYLARWVADVRNIRPSTRHGYSSVIAHHLGPEIGGIRLSDLTALDVEGMLARLTPRMSAKHLRNVHAVLRRALTHAVRAGLVPRNVASREFVDAPAVTLDEPEALTADEVRRYLAAAAGDRLEALFVTAVGTGLRQGELLGLAWEDVDWGQAAGATLSGEPGSVGRPSGSPGAGRLIVRYELARIDGAYRRVEPKTDRSRRTVPLAPVVAGALQAHRERLIAEGFVPTSTGPVFTSRTGGPLNGSWLTHHHYALLERAGIRRLPFKNLRTTYGSRLFEGGVSARRIADLMGHTREKTTQRHYIATAGASEVDAVDAIERLVG